MCAIFLVVATRRHPLESTGVSVVVVVVLCENRPMVAMRRMHRGWEARHRLEHGGDLFIGETAKRDERVLVVIPPAGAIRRLLLVFRTLSLVFTRHDDKTQNSRSMTVSDKRQDRVGNATNRLDLDTDMDMDEEVRSVKLPTFLTVGISLHRPTITT